MTYEKLIEQAKKYYLEHKDTKAIQYAKRAIASDATGLDGHYWLGMSYRRLHKQGKMLKVAETLLTLVPCSALHLAYQGWAYMVKREYQKAVDTCTKALKKDANEKEAYRYRAWAYRVMGKDDLAISDYTQLKKIDPQSGGANKWLGNIYRQQGKIDLAIEYYNKAIEIDEQYSAAYNSRGVAYAKIGNTEQAKEDFTEAINKNKNNVFAHNNLGNYYFETGEFTEAIKCYNNATKIDQKYTLAYYNLGNSFYKTGKFTKAIKYYNKAIGIDQKFANAYYNLALTYHKKKNNSPEAMIAYAKALGFFPNEILFIENFPNTIKKNGEKITDVIKEKLKESPSDLVSLVGEILLVDNEWDDRLKYIHLICEVNNLLKNLEIKTKQQNGIFYQYAKGDSFVKKIRETRVLWLMPACYQNDPEEGKYFFDFFYSQFETGPLQNVFKKLIEDEGAGSGAPIAFIRSFSERTDDLQMWNSSYADNGAGVSLGVPFLKLAEAKTRPGHAPMMYQDQESTNATMSIEAPDEGDKKYSDTSQNQSTVVETDGGKAIPIKQLYFARVLYPTPGEKIEYSPGDGAYLKKIKKELKKFTKKYLENPVNVRHLKNFLPRIFLPISHLIKNPDYQHEKEWRLLYFTSIKKGKQYIKREPLRIETEEILFKDRGDREEIWLGPNIGMYPELERMKIQHLFEYDEIDDCVEIKTSKKHFRG